MNLMSIFASSKKRRFDIFAIEALSLIFIIVFNEYKQIPLGKQSSGCLLNIIKFTQVLPFVVTYIKILLLI